jgi:serine/threonine protein kinase
VVAVKVLAPHMAATSPARKRFLREARSSAQIRNENAVQVHAVEEQPLPYLVMEFIPGETLQQRLDRTGPLELAEVLRIGRQVAEGLAAAHGQGLIHRDIKPANVLIEGGPQQRVKLTDFGLARAADDASLSQSGVVAGTPMYMAPEQARGESLDHCADLFSLGSVLYVMCTGRPPFRATTSFGVLKRVAEDDPRPIREIIPEVPVWLCQVVAKLHAKDPDARYQSARDVAAVLADCESQLKHHGALKNVSRIPGGPSPRPRRQRLAWIAGSLALLLLLGGAVWCGPPALRYLRNTSEAVVAPPDPTVVQALRDLVVAKEGTRNTVTSRFAAANATRMEVVDADIDLTEARIRLAEAERNKEGVCALLEELVTHRQEQRRLTQAMV